jgi:hypothetical protein
MSILAGVAPLAPEAGHVVLEEDTISLTHALHLGELLPRLRDHAHVLVAHDHRFRYPRSLVHLHVGAADPGDLHPEQGAVHGDVRHRELPQLDAFRSRPNGGEDLFGHQGPP